MLERLAFSNTKGPRPQQCREKFLIDYNPDVAIAVAFEYVIGRLVVFSITELQWI